MFEIPQFTKTILETIEKAGYEAYLVGGCVRDLFLSRTPQDWDITSSASPFDIMRIFKNSVPTGLKYGTVTVFIDGDKAEVTTFRSEGDYHDFRRPEGVKFETDIKKDLSRRDFTINAMAYSPRRGLVDPFDGQSDLASGIIRTVRNPEERFNEDALRILRAYRFSAQLGFKIESKTRVAAIKLSSNVAKISCERIKTEFDKILLSPRPEIIAEVLGDGSLGFLYPESKYANFNKLKDTPCDLFSRWAAFLFLLGESDEKKTASTLRFSNKEKEEIGTILWGLNSEIPETRAEIKRLLSKGISKEILLKIFALKAAIEGKDCKNEQAMLENIIASGEAYNLKMLEISGSDLIKENIASGKMCGEILNELLTKVIENPSLNDRKTLLKTAKQMGQFH